MLCAVLSEVCILIKVVPAAAEKEPFYLVSDLKQKRPQRFCGKPQHIPDAKKETGAGNPPAAPADLVSLRQDLLWCNRFTPGLGISVHQVTAVQASADAVKYEASVRSAKQQDAASLALLRLKSLQPYGILAVAQQRPHAPSGDGERKAPAAGKGFMQEAGQILLCKTILLHRRILLSADIMLPG